jgi:hypothetical protein
MAVDNKATFTIELVDDVSDAASSASQALRQLKDDIDSDRRALAQMQSAMRDLKSATTPNVDSIGKLQKSMDQLKARIADNRAKMVEMGGAFGKSRSQADGYKSKLTELGKIAQGVPGPIGRLSSAVSQLAMKFKGGGLAGAILAVVAAIVAMGVATGLAAKKLADLSIASAEARRNELLRLEGMTRIRTATSMYFGLAAGKASDIQAAIDRVSASVSIGRDKVAEYAIQLHGAGQRGANLEKSLEAVAVASSGAGDAQAQWVASMSTGLALTGRSVDAYAQRVKNQFGGVVQQKMLSLEVQAQKLKESQDTLFNNVDIGPLLKAEKALNDIFSQSTASGRALRDLFGRIAQPLIDGMVQLKTVTKIFFQEAIIAELQLEIAYYKLRNALRSVFAGGSVQENVKKLGAGLTVVALAVGVIGLALAAIVLPMLFMMIAGLAIIAVGIAGLTLTLAAPFLLMGAAIYGVISLFESIDFAKWGKRIRDGLLAPLKAIPGLFKWLGKMIGKEFADSLEISSPSKVFARHGKDIAAGLELGIKVNTKKPADAAASMLGAPSAPVPVPDTVAPGAAGAGTTNAVNIDELHVHVGGDAKRGDAQGIAVDVKRALESILEGVAIQMGAPTS